jgi:hypothetical protein
LWVITATTIRTAHSGLSPIYTVTSRLPAFQHMP